MSPGVRPGPDASTAVVTQLGTQSTGRATAWPPLARVERPHHDHEPARRPDSRHVSVVDECYQPSDEDKPADAQDDTQHHASVDSPPDHDVEARSVSISLEVAPTVPYR